MPWIPASKRGVPTPGVVVGHCHKVSNSICSSGADDSSDPTVSALALRSNKPEKLPCRDFDSGKDADISIVEFRWLLVTGSMLSVGGPKVAVGS